MRTSLRAIATARLFVLLAAGGLITSNLLRRRLDDYLYGTSTDSTP